MKTVTMMMVLEMQVLTQVLRAVLSACTWVSQKGDLQRMKQTQKGKPPSSMAFTGKFEMESENNYDEFMKLLGISSDVIEKARNFKIVTEVQQDGQDFTWSQHYSGGHTMTNKFTVGKESNIQTMGGKTFKATVQMEGGKLVVNFPNYHQTSEIVGDKLVEVSTIGGVTYERVSKRLA
ncbi:gastrotropin [Nomascus leucogenys]|uniref:gastrotropin n=1 Tax=Nomascus leucogenys TaxID=61853 RepID=UPI00122D8F87|nr:gastrotropin [Nomascus leucogenys]